MKERIKTLQTPLFLAALTVLFINDFFLKESFPIVLTGKLSDFAGLIVFPIFIHFILGKWKKLIFIASGLIFIFWKSSLSQGIIDYANLALPFQIIRTVDYSDCIAILSLPIGYFNKPSKVFSFNNPILKICLGCFTLFCILASETDIWFKNRVNGLTPYELVGEYLLYTPTDSVTIIDTITFTRLNKSNFMILSNHTDKLYVGEIKRKKGDYYLNTYYETTNYWKINSFRIKNDSIYNFYSSFWDMDNTALVEECFEDIRIEDNDDNEIYYVNNKKRETLRAFNKLLDDEKGYYFVEITDKQDTIAEIIKSSDIIEDSTALEIKVYPNPFVSQITIENGFKEPVTAEIINISGQTLRNIELTEPANHLDLSDLSSGVYIIKFNTGSNKEDWSVKIIKK